MSSFLKLIIVKLSFITSLNKKNLAPMHVTEEIKNNIMSITFHNPI